VGTARKGGEPNAELDADCALLEAQAEKVAYYRPALVPGFGRSILAA
jgi:hypothetical protein